MKTKIGLFAQGCAVLGTFTFVLICAHLIIIAGCGEPGKPQTATPENTTESRYIPHDGGTGYTLDVVEIHGHKYVVARGSSQSIAICPDGRRKTSRERHPARTQLALRNKATERATAQHQPRTAPQNITTKIISFLLELLYLTEGERPIHFYKTDSNIAEKEFEFKEKLAKAKQEFTDYKNEEKANDRVSSAKHYTIKIDFWHKLNSDGSITCFAQDSSYHSNVKVILDPGKPDKFVEDSRLGMEKFYPQLEKERAEAEAKEAKGDSR